MQETSTVPALQRYVNDHEWDGKVRGCARECKLYSGGPAYIHGRAEPHPIRRDSILLRPGTTRTNQRQLESDSFSFLAHNNVAAKRIAYFRSSVMGVSRR